MTPAAPGKNTLRYNSMISAVAASLIALMPAHAVAQTQQTQGQAEQQTRDGFTTVRERPRPEYETPGARVGAFTLRGSLDFEVASTDNLFAAPSGSEVDDIIYTISPYARLSSNWSQHYLAVDANYVSRNHADFSNEDADSYSLGAMGRVDLTRATRFNGDARFSHLVSPRTDPDALLGGAPVEYDRTSLTAGIEHQFARFRVNADVFMNEQEYDSAAQSFRDNEETGLRGRIRAELGPRIDLLFQATVDDREYTNTPSLSSNGQSYLVGAVFKGDIVNGEVAVGSFQRDYDGPGIGSFDGLAIAADVDWNITQLTTITVDARRDADDQVGSFIGQPYVRTEYGARIDHELRRNIILTAGARRGEREYEIDRNDEYTSFEVGGDLLLNPRAAIRLRYEHDEVDSTGAVSYRDYDADRISAGLTLRL